MKNFRTKVISAFLAIVMIVTSVVPAMSAFAGDGVEGYYDLQIFYKDTDTIVPTYEEDGTTPFKIYLKEGDELLLKYKLIDSVFPDNGYVKWYSEAPTLADVDQNGKVKAFDSSKGAVIHMWIDNEVKTIPLIGSPLASALEKAFFNEYVDLDHMDTDAIVAIATGVFGSNSWIADRIESYEGDLVDSLKRYLDTITPNIHCQLFNSAGELVAEDMIRLVVERNDEWYANFLPNGTHITNKSQIATTQAKGASVQLYAITTPQRLQFGTVYSVKSSSIFSQGKVVATVTDGGLVSFKNTGKTTIMASPDSEDVVNAILKFINYFYTLENTGTINTDKAAEILIKYIGIDINRTVLAGILDAAFIITKVAGDAADPVQLTATAVEIIANLTLQFAYNDTIDFTVVNAQPLESFDITGLNSVKEGTEVQLTVDNIVPSVGDTTDIVWRSSDPSIARVDEKTGIVTGLDAGGSLGALSSQSCTIYATSTTNDVTREIKMTVTGKTGKYISAVDILGNSLVGIESTEKFSYQIFPKRVAQGENLYIKWGMVTGEDEEGNLEYTWASTDQPAVDSYNVGQIEANGLFTPLNGGTCTIALEAKTGYQLSDGSFYEISSMIVTKDVETGIPVEKINISVIGALGNGSSVGRNTTIKINGVDYNYATIKIGVGNAYFGHGAALQATIEPANATDKSVKWVCDNSDFELKTYDDNIIDVKRKAAKEYTDSFNIYAVSDDGRVLSNKITVCVTRNYASNNVINEKSIELVNGHDGYASHTMTFEGSWDGGAYACYDANWYSSDESVFTVRNRGNDNSDAVLTGTDVGTATLYCVSGDGAYIDSVQVTVKPDKQRLEELVYLCDNTIVLKTKFNADDYKNYMRKLDLAYTVLYEMDMASQATVDTYADDLLAAFIKVGGFIGISKLDILGTGKTQLDSDYVTVKVGATSNYKGYSYDFDYAVFPAGAMYSKAVWTSSNSSISVNQDGVCTPTSNDPCSADITCEVTDYNGNTVKQVKHIAFARTPATGVTISPETIDGALIGNTQSLKPVILPKNTFGNSNASVQDVTWYSSNENVATVDQKGNVTFVYGGVAVISCITADGGFEGRCVVTVTTNYDKLELLVKQYNDLSLNEESYYPETWAPYIKAKTDAETMISKKGYSQEAVDAKYVELETAYKNLKKYVDIQRVELYLDGEPTAEFYQYDLRLLKEGISYKNAKLDLNVRLYPNNATYSQVEWVSSTSDISVTTDGVCSPTANKSCYGSITCTVTDSFGKQFSDDVWVSFSYNPVTGVRVSQDSISGTIGSQYQLTEKIEPEGSSLLHINAADIKDHYWESDDETVATVDQNGLVTFKGAGSTIVRCVSYDGGHMAECKVSAEGDRSALKAAIDLYANVDYTQYEYQYGMDFKEAYEEAQAALVNKTLTQKQIDAAASKLEHAGELLADHPYIRVQSINVAYATQSRGLSGSITPVKSGTIGTSDAISVDLSNGYSNYNDYNDVILTASSGTAGAMFKSVTWQTIEKSNMDISPAVAKVTLHPTSAARTGNAWAKIKAVYTDHYNKTTERIIYVSMSDNVCTGLTVQESNLSMKGTDSPYQLHYSTTGETGYTDTVMFFSDDPSIAEVSSSGVITPRDNGETIITVKTLCGGYTRLVKVSIVTDFTVLAERVERYAKIINDVKDSDQYTEESLNALSEQVRICREIVDDGKASQAEVNEALVNLEKAYNGLTGYIPATGVEIYLNDDQKTIKEVNPGFFRYEANTLNNTYVQLAAKAVPGDGMYDKIEWTSSSSQITVSETGKVTNTNTLPSAAEITCTITTVYGETYSDVVYVSFVRNPVTEIGFETDLLYGYTSATNGNETKAIPVVLKTNAMLESTKPSVELCLYEVEDETIATVDGDGNVTFRKVGTTYVKVTTVDGGLSARLMLQTTYDTSSLQAQLEKSRLYNYQDYAFEYGTAFKDSLENAENILTMPNASQAIIDEATADLMIKTNALEGHEFVAPTLQMTVGEAAVENGASFKAKENALTVDYTLAGMYKTYEITAADAENASASIGNGSIVLTKTAEKGKITIKAHFVDDYGREYDEAYTIYLVDNIVTIDDISITLDGVPVTEVVKSGYGLAYRDFEPFKLGYVSNTENATAPTSVVFTASNSDYITVTEDGVVNLTLAGKAINSNSTNITCTVTNQDGSTASTTIPVTIKRK